jgi:N-acetylgalactosamine PTS system EIIA component
MSDPVRGVVVAHADLARALIAAVDRIVGLDDDVLVPVSNDGLGPDAVRARIAEAAGTGPSILFTDLREGSCGMAARRTCLNGSGQVMITGVNLPMLLDFAMNRTLPLDALVDRLVDRAQRAIECVGPAGAP